MEQMDTINAIMADASRLVSLVAEWADDGAAEDVLANVLLPIRRAAAVHPDLLDLDNDTLGAFGRVVNYLARLTLGADGSDGPETLVGLVGGMDSDPGRSVWQLSIDISSGIINLY